MDFKEVQELIKIFNRSGLTELKIEQENFKIVIKNTDSQPAVIQQVAAPAPIQQAAPAIHQVAAPAVEIKTAASAPKAEVPAGTPFKSPMIGTFYRSAGPDKEPFVKVGDKVEKGTVLCIIEAMKLFNEIECEMSGTIVKILADDASPVEYDQPLFIIAP
jgi:acetyl-CoA carboxylase biotin carboxyl carrier protein